MNVDTLISTWYSVTGKDTTMTARHCANMVGGYMRPEDPGDAWAYHDFQPAILLNSFKKELGYAGAAASIDASTLIDDYFQDTFVPVMQFQDSPNFLENGNRGHAIGVRDLARWGYLILGAGNWNGTQLVAAGHYGTFGGAGTKFGEIQVSGSVPRTTGSEGSNYLDSPAGAMTTFGSSSTDQNEVGPGVFGFYTWINGISAVTGLRFWPDLPTNTMVLIGGNHQNDLVMFPTQEIVVAFRHAAGLGWEDQTLFNDTFALLIDGVTGSPSYGAEYPGSTWTTATRAAAALDSTAVDNCLASYAPGGTGSSARIVITRRGRMVYESDWIDDPQSIQSAAKALGLTLILSTASAAPTAPTGLSATADGSTKIDLAWTNTRADLPTRIYGREKP